MILTIMISCGKDFLEVTPATIQLTDEALATPDGLEGAIFAVYDFPRKAYRSPSSCLYFIAGTHLLKASGLLSPDMGMALYNSSLNSTHGPSKEYWENSYKALNQTNAIIERADVVGFTDAKRKDRLVAEARFFRAYILFYLYQRFEDIPLITKEIKDPVNDYQPASKDEIFKTITDDLLFAQDNLDQSYSQKGRVTKGTAQHLLAKVYLHLQKYSDAAAMATLVIASTQYSLLADRNLLWADNSQDNAEAIYVLEFANNALDGNDGQILAPMFQPMIDRIPGVKRSFEQGGRPWARYYPSEYLLGLFDSTDKRLQTDYKTVWIYDDNLVKFKDTTSTFKILPKGATDSITIHYRDTVKWEHVQNIQYYGPACKKYWEYGTSRTLADAPCRKSIIRYRLAETYLIDAEALWRDDKTDSALIMINKVRERAGALPLTALDEKTILDEYARELAFENEDWFALKRTGKLVEYVKKYGPDSLQTEISEAKIKMPIPQTFLDATPGYN
jgi:starch-binding outer membrane protein, SusD/RagB family